MRGEFRRPLVMTRKGHSYIDLTALADVGALLLTPSAAWLWRSDGFGLLWTNAAGAVLLGCRTIAEALEAPPERTVPESARSLVGRLRLGMTEASDILLPDAIEPRLCAVSRLATDDGLDALLAVEADEVASHNPLSVRAARLAHSIAGPDLAVALARPDGRVIAASPGFGSLVEATSIVNSLASRAISERPVKRIETFGSERRSTGAAYADTPDGPVVLLIMGPPAIATPAFPEASETREVAPDHSVAQRRTAAPAIDVPEAPPAVAGDEAADQAERLPELPIDPPESPDEPTESRAEISEAATIAEPPREPPEEIASGKITIRGPALSNSSFEKPRRSQRAPRRFTFGIDAEQRIISVSEEFAEMVGPHAAAIDGETWTVVSERLGIDRDGLVRQALSRRDTWSGVTLSWPVDGSDERTTLSLTALPSFSRAGVFEGFRGFGVAKGVVYEPAETEREAPAPPIESARAATGDGETASEETASDDRPPAVEEIAEETPTVAAAPDDLASEAEKSGDPASSAFPPPDAPAEAIATEPRSNVVHLPVASDRQSGAAARQRKRNLSGDEQDAFRRIAEALRSFGPSRAVADESSSAADRRAAGTETETSSETNNRDEVADLAGSRGGEDHRTIPEPMTAERPQGVPPAILDRIPSGFLVYRDRHLLFANRALLERLGYRDIETFAAAGGVDSLFAEASGPDSDEDGAACRVPLRAADGSQIAAEARLHIVPWEDGPATMLSIRSPDAMQAVSAEEQRSIQSRIEELEAVLDTATDGILMLDTAGSILNLNGSAEALFGVEASAVIGSAFTSLLADESRQAAIDYLDGLASNGVASVLNDGREVIGKVPDGGLIPIFMTMGRLSEGKFCAVLRDITHWKRAEEELVAARRSAEVASQQKSEFLAKISHEIRTPLNAIIGFSDVILEERFGPIGVERYREYLKDIRVSGAHLASLINDLLDLSRIESGKLDLTFEAVVLNDVIKDCVALMQPEANRRRVIIRTSLAADVPKVVADERSLRQVILNLLSNAVKFNGAGGQAIVSTILDASGEVVMRVRDTGVGMTEKEIETALQPFQQIATSGPARFEGTGLGLPLTKALVEANRAQFAITSAPSEGTLVRIAFPTERVLQA